MNIGSKLFNLSRPIIMGILNLTTDSFYNKSRVENDEILLSKAKLMLDEGASILDLGAMSSRPGAIDIGVEQEMAKLIPAIKLLKNEFEDIVISIDTYRSKVAEACIQQGADIINDISAGTADENMINVIADSQVPYIMMHMQGMPSNMQQNPQYDNVVTEVYAFFSERIKAFVEKGVKDIIVDPGFGFGKTIEHNYDLLKNLDHFNHLGQPVLVGISRKSMIYKALDNTADDALNGTSALHMYSLEKGASILRVHDVKEAMEVIRLHELLT